MINIILSGRSKISDYGLTGSEVRNHSLFVDLFMTQTYFSCAVTLQFTLSVDHRNNHC